MLYCGNEMLKHNCFRREKMHKSLSFLNINNVLCLLDRASLWLLKNKRPTWWQFLFYFTSYVLNMFRTLTYPSSGAGDYSFELPHWSYCCASDTTPTQPHRNSNTHRTKKNTTNVIQQNSCKLLMMNILMSETCWTQKKWNKVPNDLKLVFYASNINKVISSIQWYGGAMLDILEDLSVTNKGTELRTILHSNSCLLC